MNQLSINIILVNNCDLNVADGNKGWSVWTTWELDRYEGSLPLIRRKFCKDRTSNYECMIQEDQKGRCNEITSTGISYQLRSPMCQYERDFENCNITIMKTLKNCC